MRAIFYDELRNATSTITATNQDAGFPTSNLTNENPTSLWKATTRTSTITATEANSGHHDVALFNCNQHPAIDLVWELWNNALGIKLDEGVMERDGLGNFWINAPEISSVLSRYKLFIDAGAGNVAEAGILRIGAAQAGLIGGIAYDDPTEMSISYKHLGPEPRMTNNQAYDYVQKNRVYTVRGSVWSVCYTTNWLPKMLVLAKEAAPYPVAIKFWSSVVGQWMQFGRFNCSSVMPQRFNQNASSEWKALVNFDFEEVI